MQVDYATFDTRKSDLSRGKHSCGGWRLSTLLTKDADRIESCANSFAIKVDVLVGQSVERSVVVFQLAESIRSNCQYHGGVYLLHLLLLPRYCRANSLLSVVRPGTIPRTGAARFPLRPALSVRASSPSNPDSISIRIESLVTLVFDGRSSIIFLMFC